MSEAIDEIEGGDQVAIEVNANTNRYFQSDKNNFYKIFDSPIKIANDQTSTASLLGNFANYNKSVNVPDSVTDASWMFSNCQNMNSTVKLGNNVRNIAYMFNHCDNYDQPFDMPSSVVNAQYTFMQCSRFNSPVNMSPSLETSYGMFSSCYNFNQPVIMGDQVTTAYSMFSYCYNFNSPVRFSTALSNYVQMFYNCSNFNQPITITQSGNVYQMLYNCNNFNSEIHLECPEVGQYLNSMCISNTFNAPVYINNTINAQYLFNNKYMFNQPVAFPSTLKNAYYMFYNCASFNSPITGEINANNIQSMFYKCSEFNQPLNITGTSISGYQTFTYCDKFNQPINTTRFSYFYETFAYCNNFNQPLFINGSATNVIRGCVNFNSDIHLEKNSPGTTACLGLINSEIFNGNIYMNQDTVRWPARNWWQPDGTVANQLLSNNARYNYNGYVKFGKNMINYLYAFNEFRNFNQPVTIYRGTWSGYSSDNQSVDCRWMFRNCWKFNSPVTFNWYIRNDNAYYLNYQYMFEDCFNYNQPVKIQEGNGYVYATGMFTNCYNLNSNVTIARRNGDYSNLFYNCFRFAANIIIDYGVSTSQPGSMYSGLYNLMCYANITDGTLKFTDSVNYNYNYDASNTYYNCIYNMFGGQNTYRYSCPPTFNMNIMFGNNMNMSLNCILNNWLCNPSSPYTSTNCAKLQYNAKITIGNMMNCSYGLAGFRNFNQPITIPSGVYNCAYMFQYCNNMQSNITIQGDYTSTTPFLYFLYGRNNPSYWTNTKKLNIIASYKNTANQLIRCSIFGNTSGTWSTGTNYYYNSYYNVYIYYPA